MNEIYVAVVLFTPYYPQPGIFDPKGVHPHVISLADWALEIIFPWKICIASESTNYSSMQFWVSDFSSGGFFVVAFLLGLPYLAFSTYI